jgi:hypothetical protein
MMGKRRSGSPPPPTPTDSEAGAFARTARQPVNLEEQATEAEMAKKKDQQASETPGFHPGGGTQPIPEEPGPGLIARAAAALTTGFCDFCNTAAAPDPKKVHKCARCRREPIGA